jgi:hypothetical protein
MYIKSRAAASMRHRRSPRPTRMSPAASRVASSGDFAPGGYCSISRDSASLSDSSSTARKVRSFYLPYSSCSPTLWRQCSTIQPAGIAELASDPAVWAGQRCQKQFCFAQRAKPVFHGYLAGGLACSDAGSIPYNHFTLHPIPSGVLVTISLG